MRGYMVKHQGNLTINIQDELHLYEYMKLEAE